MTRTIHTPTPMGRVARPFVAVLALAALACGGDKSKSTVTQAEAHGVTAVPAITPPTAVKDREGSGNVPAAPPTFETAGAAYKAGDFRVAAELYKTKVDSAPDDAFGQYMLGLSSWKAGDFTGAKAAFDKSIELDPKFAKAYFNEARVLLDLQRAPEALEMIGKGREIDSTSSDGWRLTARAKVASGDVEGAMATYRELLMRDDTDAWGLNNYGMLLFDRGEFDSALGPLARAVQLRPTAPVFLNNLGMALEKSGHPVAALHRYELAVENDSTYVKAVKNVERLKAIVTDSTVAAEVDVDALAEQFRLKVRSWKDEVPKS
jgi:tetratricopeptide (TPR) repeat protein